MPSSRCSAVRSSRVSRKLTQPLLIALTNNAAWRVFHAELHQLLNKFWVRHANMLCRLGEILILGDLGIWIGFQQVGMAVFGNPVTS